MRRTLVLFIVCMLVACSSAGETPTPEADRSLVAATAECVLFGQMVDGTPLWLGDCVPALPDDVATDTETATTEPSATDTASPAPSDTPAATETATPTDTSTAVPVPPSATPEVPATPSTPSPDASLCPDHGELHDTTRFHTLWNSAAGCHYDLEHGDDPFVPEVRAVFAPLGNLEDLLGGVQIGHTNLSSPRENAAKHGGMKWYVHSPVAFPGAVGFEGATVGICDVAAQIHNYGDYSDELEGRLHTANVFLHQCMGSEHGYLYVVQLMDYGQRVVPYQGPPYPYPDNFLPLYPGGFGPYVSVDCDDRIPPAVSQCASSSAVSKWTSKRTGPVSSPRPQTSTLLQVLFDVRNTYQVIDWNDQVHPFTWLYNCTSDGGVTFNPVGCWHNNAASELHEIAGTIPAAWDNAANFDTDPRVGRITAEAYVTGFGQLLGFCPPNVQCYPIKLVNAFVGKWGADLCPVKCSLITQANTNSRDIFFLNGQVVSETTPGAVPSGWIGDSN